MVSNTLMKKQGYKQHSLHAKLLKVANKYIVKVTICSQGWELCQTVLVFLLERLNLKVKPLKED